MTTSFSLENIITDEPVAISGNTVSDYTFLGATLCYTMQVAGKTYNAQLQNGQDYYHMDYNQPSNTPTLYSDYSDEIFKKLEEISESDFDKDSKHYEYVCEVAEELEISVDDLAEAYIIYQNILADAKNEVLSMIED